MTEPYTATDPGPAPADPRTDGPGGAPAARRARVLCLGNDLVADDGLGPAAAELLKGRLPDGVDVIVATGSGFDLLDHTLGADRLVVIDVMQSGDVEPGSVVRFDEGEVGIAPGGSPHYTGLFEALELGRRLGLAVPAAVSFVAVEAADLLTVGGAMTPEVRGALPEVVRLVAGMVGEPI